MKVGIITNVQFFTFIYLFEPYRLRLYSNVTHNRTSTTDKSTRKSGQTPNVFDDTTKIKRIVITLISREDRVHIFGLTTPRFPLTFFRQSNDPLYIHRAHDYTRQIHHENHFSRPFSVPLYRVISLGLRYRTSEPHLIPRI